MSEYGPREFREPSRVAEPAEERRERGSLTAKEADVLRVQLVKAIAERDEARKQGDWLADNVNRLQRERDRLAEALERAHRCLTLIGYAGKTWGEKAVKAEGIIRAALQEGGRG